MTSSTGKKTILQNVKVWGIDGAENNRPIPLNIDGSAVETENTEALRNMFSILNRILSEIKKTNLHLSLMTDENIEDKYITIYGDIYVISA